MDNLFNLIELDPNDYFDFDDETAKKWYVDIKLTEVMNMYGEYLDEHFNTIV
jgi:hypothetical protein